MTTVDYGGAENAARTNAEQSETSPEFRVSYESRERFDHSSTLPRKACLADIERARIYFVAGAGLIKIGVSTNEAALGIPEVAEALHRAWPEIYHGSPPASKNGRTIISREAWDALILKHRRAQEQLERYTLPTQRGARNRTKATMEELSRQIRNVDGVIGIDA